MSASSWSSADKSELGQSVIHPMVIHPMFEALLVTFQPRRIIVFIARSNVEALLSSLLHTYAQVSHFIDVDLSVFPHKAMSDICQLLTVDLNTLGAETLRVRTIHVIVPHVDICKSIVLCTLFERSYCSSTDLYRIAQIGYTKLWIYKCYNLQIMDLQML